MTLMAICRDSLSVISLLSTKQNFLELELISLALALAHSSLSRPLKLPRFHFLSFVLLSFPFILESILTLSFSTFKLNSRSMVLSPRSLPPELWTEIVKLLPLADQRAFSLVSRSARNLVLPSLFGYLSIFGNPTTDLWRIHDAGPDVKAVVRWVDPRHVQHREWDVKRIFAPRKVTFSKTTLTQYPIGLDEDILFQFLSTLPNLQSLEYHRSCFYVPKELSRLLASVQYAPLRQLTLHTGHYPAASVKGPFVVLPDLEELSIYWRVYDNPGEPGGSFAHLYEFVGSLPKLVSLLLDIQPTEPGPDLNLHFFKTAGNTIRIFHYVLRSSDTGILDTIAEIFPHVTKLSINWLFMFVSPSACWTVRMFLHPVHITEPRRRIPADTLYPKCSTSPI
jgi:hypothetical protein